MPHTNMVLTREDSSLTTQTVWQAVLYSSLTINFCVLWSQLVPNFLQIFLPLVSKDQARKFLSSPAGGMAYISRMCTNAFFHISMPVVGLVLLVTSDVLSDPFFTFEESFLVVFSIQIGRLSFVILRDTLSREHSANRATTIHHSVAIGIYAVIIYYRQSAILGLLGMVLEGHLLLQESTKVLEKFDTNNILARPLTFQHILSAIAAVLFRAVVPLVIICIVCSRSNVLESLFAMDYLPLAYFFLATVFYLAISCWIIVNELQKTHHFCTKSKQISRVLPVKVAADSSFVNPLAVKNLHLDLDGSYLSKNLPNNPKNEETKRCKFTTVDLAPPPYLEDAIMETEDKQIQCRLVLLDKKIPSNSEFEDVPL